MQLSFGAADIEHWASLSGDRNPIHFDREAARRMAAPDVVAHGMLVLLPIKQHLGRLAAPGAGQWLQFRALLKSPVVRDAQVRLETTDKGALTQFKLRQADDQTLHLQGNAQAVDTGAWQSSASQQHIAAASVADWVGQFRQSLGRDCDDWVALDALVFGDFVRHQVNTVFARLAPDLRQPQTLGSLEELASHLLVVQTSHQVACCPSLRTQDALHGDVAYQIDNIELIESPDQAVGTLDLGVRLAGRHLMTITLGLMVKNLQTPQGAVQ
ncbi:MAG: MaoC family dehydratase [Paucimonas sp.]|jgi:hypothetical protein|nr:MaoC family dehydratase [Paucimonas sp.]